MRYQGREASKEREALPEDDASLNLPLLSVAGCSVLGDCPPRSHITSTFLPFGSTSSPVCQAGGPAVSTGKPKGRRREVVKQTQGRTWCGHISLKSFASTQR